MVSRNPKTASGLLLTCLSTAVWFLAVIAAPLQAKDSFDDAVKAYGEGDFETAAEIWTELSIKGHSVSQHNLAGLYEHGLGVDADMPTAVEWYRRSAIQNNPMSQLNLGNILYVGVEGVPKDLTRTVYWWTKAAEAGFAEAQFRLGKLYAEGKEWDVNLTLGRYWLKQASKQGHLGAESYLHTLNETFHSEARTAQWLKQQNPDLYTLQLDAFKDEQSARNYMEENGLANSALVQTRFGWHLVLAGMFDSFEDAHHAILNLPPHVRDTPPQIRQVSTLQKSLAD